MGRERRKGKVYIMYTLCKSVSEGSFPGAALAVFFARAAPGKPWLIRRFISHAERSVYFPTERSTSFWSFNFAHYKKKHYFFSLRFFCSLKKSCGFPEVLCADSFFFSFADHKKSRTFTICFSSAVCECPAALLLECRKTCLGS